MVEGDPPAAGKVWEKQSASEPGRKEGGIRCCVTMENRRWKDRNHGKHSGGVYSQSDFGHRSKKKKREGGLRKTYVRGRAKSILSRLKEDAVRDQGLKASILDDDRTVPRGGDRLSASTVEKVTLGCQKGISESYGVFGKYLYYQGGKAMCDRREEMKLAEVNLLI